MKTALVFGASGQIGMPLLHRLGERGWRVLAVSRDEHSDAPGRHWLQGEFANMPPLPEAVDAIFSCGPLDAFARWYSESHIDAPRIVAFGSTSAMTKHDSEDEHERDLVRRLLGAEAALFASSEQRGTTATMLRPTLVYGRGRDATLSRIAALARRHGRFPLPRGADGLRQPAHVGDLADAAFAASQSVAARGRAYDLPGGETLPYRDMVKRVLDCLEPPAKLLELPMPLFRLTLRVARSRGIARELTDAAVQRMREDMVFDAAPARRDFGYAPRAFAPTADMFKPVL
ncbi:nucleoside-diphosphate sugar epimerase [Pseudoluteimonas lycopersici]|uniref:Nucleoside-diphosphate sugar epimerase n=1 Tax=Pseudoluteimonas lycopersici TaxID=1324796 RepID=A0A516V764_9GAMM|nr:NAD-dependent epimerase/dehydratase family protein [Lysobacter lycopersici]QDQ74386.1 nucleoside-diphosphate sugar epimerase [Lysobacter lycopersici]